MTRYETHAFVWVRKEIRDRLRELRIYSTEPMGEVIARLTKEGGTTKHEGIKYEDEVETVDGVH